MKILATDVPLNPAIADISELLKLRFAARELTFFPRMAARHQQAGAHQSRFRGRGIDFDEVRPYQPGDDIRTIDWRVTARTTTPHTKLFREERERPVLVITDLRPSMFLGSQELKSVTAAKIAATLAWAGLYANDRVGGLIFGAQQQQDFRPRRSHHSVLQIIHGLSDYTERLLLNEPCRYSLAEILTEARRVVHPGTTLFIVSDFHDIDSAGRKDEASESQQHLFQLAKHCDLTLCHTFDTLDSQLPPPGSYAVSNGEQQCLLNTRRQPLRQQFEQQFRNRQSHLRQLCNRLSMGYLSFRTGQPIIHPLLQAYSGKRNRRSR